ncbi:hypothetical protein [Spongiibacter marinus]|uniref:hypothetical protein n=1 Tax=Spongiibacter marinus TaxID=354246 RepID=UPI00356AFB98
MSIEKITDYIKGLWDEFVEFLLDIPLIVFDGLMNALATALEAVPVPDFVSNADISSYIHPDIGFFLAQSGVTTGLAFIGSAMVFRFFRRVLTLGIW